MSKSVARRAPGSEADDDDQEDGGQADKRRNLPLWPGITDGMEDFGGLPVPRRLLSALSERGIVDPSGIQSLVMPRISTGENVIINAPTGAGKTLSYLLPLLARLQPTVHVGAQIIVLVPTAELALQITRELRWLVEALCGQEQVCWFNPQVPKDLVVEVLLSRSGLWDAIRQDTAILVSTPSLIVSELLALKNEATKFHETLAYFMGSNLAAIVMDEVDAMFPDLSPKKAPEKQIVGKVERVVQYLFTVIRQRYRNRPIQLVCCSATSGLRKVRATLERMLAMKWPKRRDVGRREIPVLLQHDAKPVRVRRKRDEYPLAHVIIPSVIVHAFATLDADDLEDRFRIARVQMATDIGKTLRGNVLVFVPLDVKLDAMVLSLREAGVTNCFKYRSAIGLNEEWDRSADMDDRLSDPEAVSQSKSPRRLDPGRVALALSRGEELRQMLARGDGVVLVAKENTARGVDLQGIRYVILLRPPDSSQDYQHLAGRTGRMGRPGTVITIVSPPEAEKARARIEPKLGIQIGRWDMRTGQVLDWESGEPDATVAGQVAGRARLALGQGDGAWDGGGNHVEQAAAEQAATMPSRPPAAEDAADIESDEGDEAPEPARGAPRRRLKLRLVRRT